MGIGPDPRIPLLKAQPQVSVPCRCQLVRHALQATPFPKSRLSSAKGGKQAPVQALTPSPAPVLSLRACPLSSGWTVMGALDQGSDLGEVRTSTPSPSSSLIFRSLPFISLSVFVFYCCIKNYHKLSSLKQHHRNLNSF